MKNIFLFLFSFIISCFFLDIFLKYTRITAPTIKYYDTTFGSLNRPNIQYFKSVEGIYIGSTNYDGRFRENYPPRKADKKTLRILLFGDSFVEGIDVLSENHFANYMEQILKEKLHRNVEIINYGKGNAIIATSGYFFINYIQKYYDADIVLFFTEGRDIHSVGKGAGLQSTAYILDSNSNLVPSYSWQNSWEYKMHRTLSGKPVLKYYDEFAFFRLAYRAMARIRLDGAMALTFGKFVNSHPSIGVNYSKRVNNDTISEASKKLFDTVYKYNKGQVVYVCRNFPVNYPALLRYVKNSNYKYINCEDTFDNYYIKNTKIDAYYFKATNTYGGHWNNAGHEAVGHFLADKILQNMDSYNMPDYER